MPENTKSLRKSAEKLYIENCIYKSYEKKTRAVGMGHAHLISSPNNLVYKNRGDGKTMNYDKILYWALVLFSIYLAIEILRRVFGGSFGFEELVIALLVGNLGYAFQLNSKVSRLDSKVSEHLGCTEMRSISGTRNL